MLTRTLRCLPKAGHIQARQAFQLCATPGIHFAAGKRPVYSSVPLTSQVRFFSGDAEEEDMSTRYWLRDGQKVISPWHDVPLSPASGVYNFFNEIPKGWKPKMEVATDEEHNPVKQDTKNGKLRFFTYGDLPFNYGMLPQTYEDPDHQHPDTGYNGDKDPVDVVELSEDALDLGTIVEVKVLGCMALIDEEETDWKILALSTSHPEINMISSIEDYEQRYPGKVEEVRDWFKNYKTTDGKPVNSYAFDEQVKDKAYAEGIIQETHQSWKDLLDGRIPDNGLWFPGCPSEHRS